VQVLLGCSRVGALVTVGRGTDPAAGGLAALGPEDLAPLREAIRAVLDDRDQRAAAQRVAAEIAVTDARGVPSSASRQPRDDVIQDRVEGLQLV